MRIHFDLLKAFQIVRSVERAMSTAGLHVHGLSGEDLGKITDLALKTGQDVKTAIDELGLTHKASATAPEVQ